ncbi:hypothetical protein Tco_0188315, partial [Tanacetum coccineum]
TPGSDKGRLRRQKLMTMCTKLSKHVLNLETNVPIIPHDSPLPGGYTPGSDKERQRKSSTSQPRRRKYKHVESSDDDLDEEDASKQGRKSDKTNPMLYDSDFDGFDDKTVDAATTGVSTASTPVTTCR